MTIKYHVRLSKNERSMLEGLIKQEKPKVAQYKKRNANILLAIDENNDPLTHEQVAKAFHVRPLTITRPKPGRISVTNVRLLWIGASRLMMPG